MKNSLCSALAVRSTAILLSAGLACGAAFAQQPGVETMAMPAGTHAIQNTGPKKPLPSPAAEAEVKLDGKALTIHYNTPHMRGRKIMGGLVPYGKVWRTGANPATSFVTEGDLMIGDLKVPAGKYTLYTMPAESEPWMLIINKQTGQWGTVYNQNQDLGRTPMHKREMPSDQEVMSISFEHTTKSTTQLHVKWEKTDIWVEIKAEK